MRCPQHGDDCRLFIDEVPVTVEVFSDGAEQVGDMPWTDRHPAHCSQGWRGTVRDLTPVTLGLVKVMARRDHALLVLTHGHRLRVSLNADGTHVLVCADPDDDEGRLRGAISLTEVISHTERE